VLRDWRALLRGPLRERLRDALRGRLRDPLRDPPRDPPRDEDLLPLRGRLREEERLRELRELLRERLAPFLVVLLREGERLRELR